VVVSAFLPAGTVAGLVLNIGSDELTTVNEVLAAVAEATGKPSNVTFVDKPKLHMHHMQVRRSGVAGSPSGSQLARAHSSTQPSGRPRSVAMPAAHRAVYAVQGGPAQDH